MPDITARRSIWQTPLRDLLRGRITGRLDLAAKLAASNLPAPATNLIARVVKRTRLWRLEKADVADELIAHFQDGLADGETIDGLLVTFGDERQAAKLIRRAKKRGRPWAWHVARAIGWSVGGVVVVYAAIDIHCLTGHPTPTVDYVAELNAPIFARPAADRAWPLYRDVYLRVMPSTFEDRREPRKYAAVFQYDLEGKHWPEIATWVQAHAGDIAQLREAAARPIMGFVLGPGGSAEDPPMFASGQPARPVPFELPGMSGVLVPYLNSIRALAMPLAAEAKMARLSNDPTRWFDDVSALFDLADQLRSDRGLLVTDLVAIGIDFVALKEIDSTLAAPLPRLSNATLIALAHRLSGPSVAADLIDFSGEQMLMADQVQRMFTDDGHGDGHFTVEGLRLLHTFYAIDTGQNPWTRADALERLAGEIALPAWPSRRDFMNFYNHQIQRVVADYGRPARDARDITLPLDMPILTRLRYGVILATIPALQKPQWSAELELGQRDGLVIAVALELYRRKHGRYPQTLEMLTPELLATIPADRITGEPVKYRLADGKPLVYSVGADRADDGGRPPFGRDGKPEPRAAAVWHAWAAGPKGDWILYPMPRISPEDDD